MKNFTALCGVLMAVAGAAQAGGVDRSGQPIGIIFERGNYAELSFGQISPSVSGTYLLGGAGSGNVAGDHRLPGIAFKYDLNEKLSVAVIYDNAYGADIDYPTGPLALLGGTAARLDSEGVTGLLRYKLNESFSVHGGIRASKAGGEVTLAGPAYAPSGIDGYNVKFDDAWGTGYAVGAAFEKPEIGLRVALTYFSKVNHKLGTAEDFPAFPIVEFPNEMTSVDTPQAVNLDFQTGVAKDTLVFGSIRWVDWSEFDITPPTLNRSLTDLNDTTTYTLGVGRKFNENWSGSVFAMYEPGTSKNASPLAPTNGYRGIGIGVAYTRDSMKVSLGARYIELGDANAAPGGTPVAAMSDNSAVAVGLKVGFAF